MFSYQPESSMQNNPSISAVRAFIFDSSRILALTRPLALVVSLSISLAYVQGCSRATPEKVSVDSAAAPAKKSVAELSLEFKGAKPTADSLVSSFMQALLKGNGQEAYLFLPSLAEYEAIYPHMPDADTNPESPHMIATMLISSNQKELPRWMTQAQDYAALSRMELGPSETHDGYELITKIHVFVKDSKGAESELPVFRTLIKLKNGYKIWLLLET